MSKKAVLASAAVFVAAAALPAFANKNMNNDEEPVKVFYVGYETCESKRLRIRLNIDNGTSKEALIWAFDDLRDYPDLRVKAWGEDWKTKALEFTVKARCESETEECAREAGWYDVQRDLQDTEGGEILCDEEDEPQQDEAQEDDNEDPTYCPGGVIIGTHPRCK